MASPILYLKSNVRYTFKQYLKDHLTIFSTDPLGGKEKNFDFELTGSEFIHFYQTAYGAEYEGETHWNSTEGCFYSGSKKGPESQKIFRYKTEFIPNESRIGSTVYYVCWHHESEGGQINIISDAVEGEITNPEEKYFLLGIQQTNRTYHIPHSKEISDNFLANTVPAGLSPKLFNFAPQVKALGPEGWIDPNNGEVSFSLSGLIIDPENDILTYKWTQVFPEEAALTGTELLGEFSDPTSPSTTFTIESGQSGLEIPPVDTAYTFKLTVEDSDNIAFDTVDVKVSGLETFDLFSDTGFAFSDINLTFDTITEIED